MYSRPFFPISTLVGNSIMVRRVCKGGVVSIYGKEILADFIKLDILDFDTILQMDWLY